MLITFTRPLRHGEWTPQGNVFVALATYDERGPLKAAGFRWDKDLLLPGEARPGHWWTDSDAIAARLGAYADETVAPMVRDLVASRKASRRTVAAAEVPAPLGREYMPFQLAAIAYAMERPNVLFADEMGLGKTIEAIGFLNTLDPAPERVLVVCPASLKVNWQRELHRWLVAPLRVGVVTPQHIPPAQVLIVNYDLLVKHEKFLRPVQWDALIADEVHYAKNPKAQRSAALYGLKATHRLALTGTPIVNRPGELYPIISWLDPERWKGKKEKYLNRYTAWGDRNRGRNLEELQDVLRSTIMVRRLKADVLTELPPKRRQIVEYPVPAGAREVVEREMANYRSLRTRQAGSSDEEWSKAVDALGSGEWGGFTELSELRHQTALAKVPVVVDHMRDVLEQTNKVVLFAHHRDVLEQLYEAMTPYGASLLTGDTPLPERQRLVDRFQNTDEHRVFVASILAAGVGLTLTAADTVVFAELDWVPGNMKQAEDRCHRIGSEIHESILIHHVVLEGSMDVEMAQLIAEKLWTIERALDREVAPVVEAEVGSLGQVVQGSVHVERPRTDADYPSLPGGLAQVEAIKGCLQLLAGLDPDRAGILNDQGFNGVDTGFGHALAEQAYPLTSRQAEAARKLLVKYIRQLPRERYELAVNGHQKEGVLQQVEMFGIGP